MIDGTVATSNDYNPTVIFAASSPKDNNLFTALSRRSFCILDALPTRSPRDVYHIALPPAVVALSGTICSGTGFK